MSSQYIYQAFFIKISSGISLQVARKITFGHMALKHHYYYEVYEVLTIYYMRYEITQTY